MSLLADGRIEVQAVEMSAEPLIFDDIAMVGESIVVLASRGPDRDAGAVLRSDDGGLSWTSGVTPLVEPLSGPHSANWAFAAGQPHLLQAGEWLVATRTIVVGGRYTSASWRANQAVAVSGDAGETWRLADLPVPPGTTYLVHDAIEIDGVLILGGATQSTDPLPSGYTFEAQEARWAAHRQAYDAALWRSTDGGTTFERLASGQFDDEPDAQVIRHLVTFDGRLIAIGGDSQRGADPRCCFLTASPTAWASEDRGDSWTLMPGMEPDSPFWGDDVYLPPDRTDQELVLRMPSERLTLDAGSTTWLRPPVAEGWWGLGQVVELEGLGAATTWNENVACDCSVAMAGRLEGDQLVASTELQFQGCADESVRGFTKVDKPFRIGTIVVALAACNHHNQSAAAFAWTADGGVTWDTERLTAVAETLDSTELVVPGTWPDGPFIRVGETLVVVLARDATLDNLESEQAAPLVALRLRPTD